MSDADDTVKKRHADIEQDGLFDEPQRSAKPRRRYVKPSGRGTCPTCGLVEAVQVRGPDGKPQWRLHHRNTIAGRPIMCAASGTAVKP